MFLKKSFVSWVSGFSVCSPFCRKGCGPRSPKPLLAWDKASSRKIDVHSSVGFIDYMTGLLMRFYIKASLASTNVVFMKLRAS